MKPLARVASHVVMLLARLLGGGSLLLFAWLLLHGSLDLVVLPLGTLSPLALDAALCLAFFVQHSGMIRRSYRRVLARLVPEDYHPALYSIASGVVLTTLVVLWQRVGPTFWVAEGAMRWLAWSLYPVALLGFAWGARALGGFDAFGIRPIRRRLRDARPKPTPLAVRGPYRWVRHPLYTATLVMIWACPTLTADRLLFDVAFTAWIFVGSRLEERDLLTEFGKDYRDYQQRVPMLIPRPWRGPTRLRLPS